MKYYPGVEYMPVVSDSRKRTEETCEGCLEDTMQEALESMKWVQLLSMTCWIVTLVALLIRIS